MRPLSCPKLIALEHRHDETRQIEPKAVSAVDENSTWKPCMDKLIQDAAKIEQTSLYPV